MNEDVIFLSVRGQQDTKNVPQTHLNPTKLKNKQPGYLKMSDSECVAKTSSHLRRRRALTEAERKNTVYSLYNGRKLFL